MKTKNIVIGCLALLLIGGVIAGCVVGGIFMLGLSGVAEQAEQERADFGKRTDQIGCQNEALRLLRAANKSGNILKRRETSLFLYGCFQTSRPTLNYCANAPKEDSFFPVREWSQARCEEIGAGNDDACEALFVEVSDVCLGKTKKRTE